jgi:hypothetical protein
MSNSYIFAGKPNANLAPDREQSLQIDLDEFRSDSRSAAIPAVGERMLVTANHNGEYAVIEPYLFRVNKVESNKVRLTLEGSYTNPVPMERVRTVINRSLSYGGNALAPREAEALIALMGPVRIPERQLLDHIKRFIAARGYYFDDETIANYHVCLKTRPFVILAGLSGTGKSKLSQLYAEAMGHTVQNNHYLRLAVRPSWNDDRYLLGYVNTITGEYVSEPALDFLVQAERDRENLYFFCLDEMNLAHVEYYFSQFLSAMEEENPADRRILLFSEGTQRRLSGMGSQLQQERVVLLPTNLLFTGTINVDETTQPLSDKVIDRANTLEFFGVELDKIPAKQPPPDIVPVSAHLWQSYITRQPDATYRDQIIAIGKILNKAGLGLGYRVLRDIELYLANGHGLLEPAVAFDLQVKQRILPRVRGAFTIQETLNDLSAFAKQHQLPRTLIRLEEMSVRLKRDGYTSFWR